MGKRFFVSVATTRVEVFLYVYVLRYVLCITFDVRFFYVGGVIA